MLRFALVTSCDIKRSFDFQDGLKKIYMSQNPLCILSFFHQQTKDDHVAENVCRDKPLAVVFDLKVSKERLYRIKEKIIAKCRGVNIPIFISLNPEINIPDVRNVTEHKNVLDEVAVRA
jgi:hypothetical protein